MKPLNHLATNVLLSAIIALLFAFSVSASNFAIPPKTAIPVFFSRTLDARKMKPGDTVTVKTMQVVRLPSGQEIPKNSLVVGHVVNAEASSSALSPSRLAIQFDSIVVKKETFPIRLSVRALAAPNESWEATNPTGPVGADVLKTTTLIGGDYTYLADKNLYSPNGQVVGENRGNGIFARLIPSGCGERENATCCGGTATPQSLAIYSPSACGLYGFSDIEMTEGGESDLSGIFTLESSTSFVRIYGRSTALLQVIGYI